MTDQRMSGDEGEDLNSKSIGILRLVCFLTQGFHRTTVGRNSLGNCRKRMVRQSVTLAMFPDNAADPGIVNMADPGKQMVFNLVIQSSNKPTYDFVFWSKISRRSHLVHGPF